MNEVSNQQILSDCDAFTVASNAATACAKLCAGEILGQVSRIYGKAIRLADAESVINELLLSMVARIHRDSFTAGEKGSLLPDERRVKNQMMTWAGLPVWVDGVVTAAIESWPLIDANDTTPKPPGQPFPEQATCTQHVQVGQP